ncbi:MAG: ParA family protein [Myxococcales bacterium]|nr:ParA family protein [Myxococcales bacterium]
MTYVVAIANQKGGVGKTTTAVNLSASLAVAEQRVLLIDMDPQGNATSGLGRDPKGGLEGTYGLLQGGLGLDEAIVPSDLPNLELITASADLAAIELEFANVEDRSSRLKEIVSALRGRYDYIIIDCPPSLGILTINALVAADAVLVPMQCEYYALEGLSQLMNTVERVRGSFNPSLRIDGVLLCMFDPRSNLSSEVANELRKHFHVYDTVIPRNIRLAEAPSYGKPIILYDAASKGSAGYLNLAREILSGPTPRAAA